MRRIAIIPARGGSKRIPRKNLVEVGGVPLLVRAVQLARKSGLFDTVHVSTDDAEVRDVALAAGADVPFLRPDDLAGDHVGLLAVLEWVLAEHEALGQRFDVGCVLLPTAPLLEVADLADGADRHEGDDAGRPALAVARYPAPPEWAFDRDDHGRLRARDEASHAVRSQDLRPAYYDSGTFMFFSCASITEGRHGRDGFLAVELPPWKAVDIDELEDLHLVEILWRGVQDAKGRGGA